MEYCYPLQWPMSPHGPTATTWRTMQARFSTYLTTYGTEPSSSIMNIVVGPEFHHLMNSLPAEGQLTTLIRQFLLSLECSCLPKFILLFQRFQFFTCSQYSSETVCAFLKRLMSIADKCEFGDVKEVLLRDQIVSGVVNEVIKSALANETNIDYSTAEGLCRRIDPCFDSTCVHCAGYKHQGVLSSSNENSHEVHPEEKQKESQSRDNTRGTSSKCSEKTKTASKKSNVRKRKVWKKRLRCRKVGSREEEGESDQGSHDLDEVEEEVRSGLLSNTTAEGDGWPVTSKTAVSLSELFEKPAAKKCSNLDWLLPWSALPSVPAVTVTEADTNFSTDDNVILQYYDSREGRQEEEGSELDPCDEQLVSLMAFTSEDDQLINMIEDTSDIVGQVDSLDPGDFSSSQDISFPTHIIKSSNNSKKKRKHKRGIRKEGPSAQKTKDSSICYICGAVYRNQNSLTQHMRKSHMPCNYKCDECGKGYPYASGLLLHQRTHTGERPYVCEICGASFTQQGGLNRHIQDHSGIRRHQCQYCQQKFLHRGTLNVHLRKHTGETPFVCQMCGAGYRDSYSLTVHVRKHTGEKPYKCDLCWKAFSSGTHLQRHKRMHSGVKPHTCFVCNTSFTRLANLRCHRKTVHGLEV